MKKLNSALCQLIVLHTNYFNSQFSYLHKFYKTNNIKAYKSLSSLSNNFRPSTKVKIYIQILHNKGTDKCCTYPHGPHGLQRMKKIVSFKVLYNEICKSYKRIYVVHCSLLSPTSQKKKWSRWPVKLFFTFKLNITFYFKFYLDHKMQHKS